MYFPNVCEQCNAAASEMSDATLQHADAPLAFSAPALPGREPRRSLQSFPLAAFGAPTRHRDSRHSHSLDGLLIL
jgi:hypothetical protein